MDYNLPETEGIDWEVAHRYLPTREVLEDTLCELVKTSSKQTEELLALRDGIESDPSAEAFSMYATCAHAMKSALRSIGSSLFDDAYELECAGRNRNEKTIIEKTQCFAENYTALTERLKSITGAVDVKDEYDEALFFDHKETVIRCRRVGATDYILKPVNQIYLKERVRIALGERLGIE